MHIVIPMAGHSRRFKQAGYDLPKFLIPVDGRPMIVHVVNMFDDNDDFHFVITTAQKEEYPELDVFLQSIAKKVHITVIEPHEWGPVYSVLQVRTIADDAPIIVSYCDFIVRWNYPQFLRLIDGYDGAIPAFKGFHPASYGNTYYAYMRANNANEMLELREKSSFTSNRQEEYASAGIYYFNSWSIFRYYAQQLPEKKCGQEGYVSLLSNLMIADQLRIKITSVEHFICWGTPEDLEQYVFWAHYFSKPAERDDEQCRLRDQINLVPMGGKGSRFRAYGYRTNKPLIQVRNKPMVVRACESFPDANQWIFLPRADDVNKYPLAEELNKISANTIIIPVEGETSGQAATCLLAKHKLRSNASLFITSCDYETRFSHKKWQSIIEDQAIDGAVWTYRIGSNLTKDPKAFAYCVLANDNNFISRIVEKNTISAHPERDPLVVGSFWFRYASDFIYMAETAIKNNLNVNGEHYIANSMNLLIEQGKKLVIFDVDQWISYGDPFELQLYFYWENFFRQYCVKDLSQHEILFV